MPYRYEVPDVNGKHNCQPSHWCGARNSKKRPAAEKRGGGSVRHAQEYILRAGCRKRRPSSAQASATTNETAPAINHTAMIIGMEGKPRASRFGRERCRPPIIIPTPIAIESPEIEA